MSYAKVENGEIAKYPYNFADLRKDNKKISFPPTYLSQAASNGEYNVVEVVETEEPHEEGSHSEEEIPTFDGSVWTQNWKLVPDVVNPPEVPEQTWSDKRLEAYGYWTEQLEFITENGLEAWQARVAEIKARFPKQ